MVSEYFSSPTALSTESKSASGGVSTGKGERLRMLMDTLRRIRQQNRASGVQSTNLNDPAQRAAYNDQKLMNQRRLSAAAAAGWDSRNSLISPPNRGLYDDVAIEAKQAVAGDLQSLPPIQTGGRLGAPTAPQPFIHGAMRPYGSAGTGPIPQRATTRPGGGYSDDVAPPPNPGGGKQPPAGTLSPTRYAVNPVQKLGQSAKKKRMALPYEKVQAETQASLY